MNVLIDTNVLGRLAEPVHPQHPLADDATKALRGRGDSPCVVPQVLYEFWVVATRPAAQNGLGLTAAQAETEISRIEAFFPLLADSGATYAEWRRLVTAHQVIGKSAHDARIVAAMLVHRVTHVLTF
ncbi:MAG TPA: PIN domain-containing protein, partial [Gemmataceae bacterium]|nr:PIN domain-containing protein [Gemmataceae bacterium]